MQFLKNLIHTAINVPGFHTNRKLVVIESDDWGSIRMPSSNALNVLVRKGIRVDNLAFNKYDSLASESDLKALFGILGSVHDKNGNPAIITANTIMTNPDFDKIKASNFSEYHYELFTETLKRYPEHAGSFELWKQGIAEGVFKPQFHGREHINVERWMKALRANSGNVRLAFDLGMCDLSEGNNITQDSFVDALNYEDEDELNLQIDSIREGLDLFEKIFGYRSATFIAPCYIWDSRINDALYNGGVRALQGGWFQLSPKSGSLHSFRKVFHFTGQYNNLNQIYLVRNASFEPSIDNPSFIKEQVIGKMEFLFRMKRPVIISSHRLNFIGYVNPQNRERNLQILAELLTQITKKWPEVEFVSSDQLLKIMS